MKGGAKMDKRTNETHSREQELDDFWNIDALIPRKKHSFAPTRDTTTAEIELPPRETESEPREDFSARRFIPPHTAEERRQAPTPNEEYVPNHALLRHVRIYHPKSTYQYYEAFVRDAVRLYPIHGEPCERVTFFSYVPQYSQMSRAQLEWYLWWRERFRNGEALATDYSYVLLYAYELINLSERLAPTLVQAELLRLWESYREIYHQLDGYLSEWICDHSLLHRLTLPSDVPHKLIASAMTHCTLKEFYFFSDASSGYAGALLAFCNNYDYKKSKFYADENKPIFDRVMPSAINLVIDSFSRDGKLFVQSRMDDSRVTRNAYTGALCAYSIKRNIEVEYCSFSRSNELRYFITDVVKYTENALRTRLSIRSRLSVYSIPPRIREMIDRHLQEILPEMPRSTKAKRENTESLAYEKRYDLPQSALSLAHAAEIEQASWETTGRLLEAFDDAEVENLNSPLPVEETVTLEAESEEPNGDAASEKLRPYTEFLRAALQGDISAEDWIAKNTGKMLDALADEINEIAAVETGDILLEENGSGYAVIEDYREWVESLLSCIS